VRFLEQSLREQLRPGGESADQAKRMRLSSFFPCPRSRSVLLARVISTYANRIRFRLDFACFALALWKKHKLLQA
jgi:hypothetical protein